MTLKNAFKVRRFFITLFDYPIDQGSVARKVNNFIYRIVSFSNFLNMFSNCHNPDKKLLFST